MAGRKDGFLSGNPLGAFLAYIIVASFKSVFVYVIGGLFLFGGITACLMIPAPVWFDALDLIIAYIPMAWLGIMIGRHLQSSGSLS